MFDVISLYIYIVINGFYQWMSTAIHLLKNATQVGWREDSVKEKLTMPARHRPNDAMNHVVAL